MKPEDVESLRALMGTEAHRAVLALVRSDREAILRQLATASGDEVLKLQGEYRALGRMEQRLLPKQRMEAPTVDAISGY